MKLQITSFSETLRLQRYFSLRVFMCIFYVFINILTTYSVVELVLPRLLLSVVEHVFSV